jgi:protein pelota
MKIEGFDQIVVGAKGNVTISIEAIEDFWTVANLMAIGDKVQAQIRRKLKNVRTSGRSDAETVLVRAWVKLTEIDYQPGVDEMRLRGTLCQDCEDATKGSFQRVMFAIGRPFVLRKVWDQFYYEQLAEAANPISSASVAAVLMQSGLANLCIIGRNSTVLVKSVQKAIPKMRVHGSSGKSQEAKAKFYEMVASALIERVPVTEMKCIIVASNGFVAKEFLKYLTDHQAQLRLTDAFQASKFVEASVPDAQLSSLEDLLANPELDAQVMELKATVQAKAFAEFEIAMNANYELVAIGAKETLERMKAGVVAKLLVTDAWIRTLERPARIEFLALRDKIVAEGAQAVQFSEKHVSGGRLQEIGGIAAILKFPVPRTGGDEFDETL